MNVSNMSFEIKENEFFYNLDRIRPTPTKIRANIPKLMPRIPRAEPTTGKESINRSIFVNASNCRPNPSSLVNTQNFVTLVKHPHEQPDYSSDVDYPPGINAYLIDRYHRFSLDIMHNDIRQMYFSTK